MFRTAILRQSIRSCFTSITKTASTDVNSFRETHYNSKTPVHFEGGFGPDIPAVRRWFEPTPNGPKLDVAYLRSYADSLVSLERTVESEQKAATFERFQAPFSVFINWCNSQVQGTGNDQMQERGINSRSRLYLAQQPISSLPAALQKDLPTPNLVSAGKGDVYASSIWLGISPTSTPMHKDPNPNLFIQMVGTKRIRIIMPVDGRMLLSLAREEIQEQFWQVHTYAGLDGMRGEEMMGLEGKLTDQYLWDSDCDVGENEEGVLRGFEATLSPGDGLFIPQGWWHSVRGTGVGLNASVNWWFR